MKLRKDRIKLKKTILIEPREGGDKVFALDTETSTVFQFQGLEARMVESIWQAGEEGIAESELFSLPKDDPNPRDTILYALLKLAAARTIEGFKPPARWSNGNGLPKAALFGAFSMGAGMLFSPVTAHAINCMSPTCGQRGGTCWVVDTYNPNTPDNKARYCNAIDWCDALCS